VGFELNLELNRELNFDQVQAIRVRRPADPVRH
jgi:hypothetical protein